MQLENCYYPENILTFHKIFQIKENQDININANRYILQRDCLM